MTIHAADAAGLAEAGRRLAAGDLVAFPTETVYGLGGDAGNDRAVAAVFAAKNRPRFNPLIIHVADTDQAATLADLDDRARALADRHWPGPLTLVLPRRADARLSLLATAGLDTVAVRVPGHPLARELIARAGCPVAAPSANRSGRLSPTRADHVLDSLGPDIWVLDGGACAVGLESTIVDLTADPAVVLRPGGLALEALGLDAVARTGGATAPRAPGMLTSHYAPERPIRLNVTEPRPDEALLALGPDVPGGAALTRNLAPDGDLVAAAANLFALLHALDRPDVSGIAVMPVPDHGLGRAINDRLRRAAAPRDEPDGGS